MAVILVPRSWLDLQGGCIGKLSVHLVVGPYDSDTGSICVLCVCAQCMDVLILCSAVLINAD